MKNIFESLSRYPPTEKNVPEENQLTESFAFLIDQIPQLSIFLLTELLEKKPKSEELTVQTQNTRYSTVSGGIHDLTIRSKKPDFLVIIENKKFSQIDLDQLKKYLKDIDDFIKEEKNRKGFLILITPPRDEEEVLNKIKENPVFIHKYWFEICRVIEDFKDEHYGSKDSSDNKNKFILEQFLDYMEVLGLTVDFNKTDFDAFLIEEGYEDDRYIAKSKLKLLVDEVHKGLPSKLKKRMKYHTVGNISPYGCWGYLSEEENQTHHAHFSLSLYQDGMIVGIRLEGKNAVQIFYDALDEDRENNYKNFLRAVNKIKNKIKRIKEDEQNEFNAYYLEIDKMTSNRPRMMDAFSISDCRLFFKYIDIEAVDYLFNRMTKLGEIKELKWNSTPMWIVKFYDRGHLIDLEQDDLVEDIIDTIVELEPLYNYVRGEM